MYPRRNEYRRRREIFLSLGGVMTAIEKFCNEHGISCSQFNTPCETIGESGMCEICPYRGLDENECVDVCNREMMKEV